MQLSTLLLLSLPLLTSALSLAGQWALQGSTEGYLISASPSNSSAFTVLCNTGPCTAWQHANLTRLSSLTVSVHFDSGVVHSGTVDSPLDDELTWQDSSVWQRQEPPLDHLDVHFIPHSHNDPGWLRTYWDLFESPHPGSE
jgi:hypothetical protein